MAVLLMTFAAFVGLAIASQLWGADTRPGFAEARSARVERWFPHSRKD